MNLLKRGIELYRHQGEMLRLLETNPQFAIFAEQGTGKTLPMLVHILNLIRRGEIHAALIVCPKAVRGSWERDIERFFVPFGRSILRRCLTITTYDLVWRRPELNREWGLMCLDESHYIKNRTSNRYAGQVKRIEGKRRRVNCGIRDISRRAQYRYIMTGTPVGNSHWEELWAQFDFLNPELFGKYSDFEMRYCLLNQFYKPYKYLHVDELQRVVAEHSYRITKAECLDLPEKLPPERYTLELQEKKLYREMLQNYIAELDIEAKNPLSRMVKLRQMCSGFVLDEDGAVHRLRCEKAAALGELLENWEKKLVIFAEFKESIRGITEVLSRKKIQCLVLDGGQKDKTVWRKFQRDPEEQVIVCQYRTANAGIDLFAADTILYYEPTLSSQAFEQSCDRVHRPGQKEKCSYLLFETEHSVETKIWDALMRYRDFDERELWAYVKEVR